MFEIVVVNEPSVFELLKFYCSHISGGGGGYYYIAIFPVGNSTMEKS